jgi:curved DNA-binding protein
VLALQPGADAAELKRAFRAQARRWHPDLNGNDPVAEERFKQVNEAYAVLSDPRRRRAWEGAAGDSDPFASGFPSFETYLEHLFGARRQRPAAASDGPDPSAATATASATAADPGARPRDRPGSVATAEPAPPPPVQASSAIESVVELSPDQALEGARIELDLPDGTAVEVWTPPLAGDGWRLRLAGVAPGGGDHFLQLRVVTPEGLRVDGLRVLFTLEISPAEAPWAAGGGAHPAGRREAHGAALLLQRPAAATARPGAGWGDQRGDQLVEVRIVVPEQPTDAELALYRRLQELALAGVSAARR